MYVFFEIHIYFLKTLH